MESSVSPWEVILFAGLFYGTVAVLLAALGYMHMLNKREMLSECGRGMHVDTFAKNTLIQRGAMGSSSPYAVTFLIWTLWIVVFVIDRSSTASLVLLIGGVVTLLGCVGLFVKILFNMAHFNKSHSGAKRQSSEPQPK